VLAILVLRLSASIRWEHWVAGAFVALLATTVATAQLSTPPTTSEIEGLGQLRLCMRFEAYQDQLGQFYAPLARYGLLPSGEVVIYSRHDTWEFQGSSLRTTTSPIFALAG
jgi:hypothetical protein